MRSDGAIATAEKGGDKKTCSLFPYSLLSTLHFSLLPFSAISFPFFLLIRRILHILISFLTFCPSFLFFILLCCCCFLLLSFASSSSRLCSLFSLFLFCYHFIFLLDHFLPFYLLFLFCFISLFFPSSPYYFSLILLLRSLIIASFSLKLKEMSFSFTV